ncbi:MAG: GH36 C-terminal domain-containing protein [Planctomycetes bacterium]|nr:GH36 C-terminal domain-containing protein [Planctomycetota bacterium]
MVQVFRRALCAEGAVRLRLWGLEPDALYRVVDLDTDDGRELTGEELMDAGLLATLPQRPQAAVFLYERVGARPS